MADGACARGVSIRGCSVAEPVRQDLTLPYWSIDQAALHFGIARRSVRRYITEGLPSYFAGTMVKPDEIVSERLTRRDRAKSTRRGQ